VGMGISAYLDFDINQFDTHYSMANPRKEKKWQKKR
jgi:hypothetical protein